MSPSAAKSPTPILDLEAALPEKFQWDRLTWRQALLIVVLPLVAISSLVPVFLVLNDNYPALRRIFSYIGTTADTLFKGLNAFRTFLLYFHGALQPLSHQSLAHSFPFNGGRRASPPFPFSLSIFQSTTPLECAVTKTPSRKSFRMRRSEKRWGGGGTHFSIFSFPIARLRPSTHFHELRD